MAFAEISVLALGANHLSFARFSSNSEGELMLHETVRQGLDFSPQDTGQWLESVDEGLKKLSSKVRLKKVKSVVLPGWAVLTKGMHFTKAQGSGQHEIIRYEAGKSMPHGLDGYRWTYDLVSDDGVECEAVVHAIQSDTFEDLTQILKKRGIKPSVMDATVSGLANAYKLNYSQQGESLILDLGAKSTTLVITPGTGSPFVRNLSFGGSQITQHLAKQLGVSFEEAEIKKLGWIRKEEASTELNEASEGFVTRLVNEIQRSLTLYRRQTGNDNPARLLLMGGAGKLPGLADFLQRKTGLTVEPYNPFANVGSSSELSHEDASATANVLPVLVGIAARNILASPIKTNFLEEKEGAVALSPEQRPWLLAAAVLFLSAGLVLCFQPHIEAFKLQAEVAQLENNLIPYESLAGTVQRAFDEYHHLLDESSALQAVGAGRLHWIAFLADLQQRMFEVEDVWLDSIVADEGDAELKLHLSGRLMDRENPLSQVSTASRNRVEALLSSFADSPFISSLEDRRFDTSQPGVLKFDFSITIQSEVAL